MGTRGAKRPKIFTPIENPQEKLNPNSIIETLNEIENEFFGGNREEAARQLTKILQNLPPSRHRPSSINSQKLTRIMENEKRLEYWHIEMFAEFLHVPSALLLTYSRLKANVRSSEGQEQSQRFLRSLRKISESTNSTMQPNIQLLKQWVAWYQPAERGSLI